MSARKPCGLALWSIRMKIEGRLNEMNGLKYIISMKELSLKEVAQEVGVTSQLVASWASGARKIPLNHAQTLSAYFKVSADHIMKEELCLNDKVQIEIQMSVGEQFPEVLMEQINLHHNYEKLEERYRSCLEEVKRLESENKALKETLKLIQVICQENI